MLLVHVRVNVFHFDCGIGIFVFFLWSLFLFRISRGESLRKLRDSRSYLRGRLEETVNVAGLLSLLFSQDITTLVFL